MPTRDALVSEHSSPIVGMTDQSDARPEVLEMASRLTAVSERLATVLRELQQRPTTARAKRQHEAREREAIRLQKEYEALMKRSDEWLAQLPPDLVAEQRALLDAKGGKP